MLFFQSSICSPSMHCSITRDTMQRKGNRNQAKVRLTASTIHQVEELHTPAALSDPTNVIGILGGESSLIFAKKLVDHNSQLPFILCMDPDLSNELLSLQKGSLLPKKVRIDYISIVEKLRRKRAILENCGVCCIVMPCHVLQCWHDEIKEGCTVPFIHMGESVAKELKEAKLRPLEAGNVLSIGVLATNTMLVTRMYQQKLEKEGFEVVMPDKNTVKHIVIPAVEAMSQKDFEGARNLLRISLRILLVRAVNRIVLASDELRELLPSDDPLWRKCLDPMDALARSTVKYAQSAGRSK